MGIYWRIILKFSSHMVRRCLPDSAGNTALWSSVEFGGVQNKNMESK
jgi:hypothetical protein